MAFAYVVRPNGDFTKDGVLLRRGDVLTGDDARWLEQPENANLLLRVNQVSADSVDDSAFVNKAGAN